MTIVQQVQTWYSERKERLSTLCERLGIAVGDGGDEVVISLMAPMIVATICVWNNGQVTIPAIDRRSGKDFRLDHKVLAPDEDLAVLLDHYVEQITSPK